MPSDFYPHDFQKTLYEFATHRVYRTIEGEPVFQEARAPTTGELQGLLVKIITRAS